MYLLMMGIYTSIMAIIGLELVALLILFAAIVSSSARKSGARCRRLQKQWGVLLPDALEGKRDATNRIKRTLDSPAARRAFQSFVEERLSDSLTTGSSLAVRHLCRSIGFTEWLQSALRDSKDELSRASAARTLARLREKSARGPIAGLLTSEDPAAVLAAGYACAAFRDPRQFLTVFQAIYRRTPITLHGAAELLSGFGEGVCPHLHGLLQRLIERYKSGTCHESLDPRREVAREDTAAQVVIVDILAFYGYLPAARSLLRLLNLVDNEEVLIHLIKALAKVGDASAVPTLTKMLAHSNWVVRSQAAQALATLGPLAAAARVRPLVIDGNPQVRISAGWALEAAQAVEAAAEVLA